jgi:dolichyl-phosphate-mannose--protein O-mannosyl transferase
MRVNPHALRVRKTHGANKAVRYNISMLSARKLPGTWVLLGIICVTSFATMAWVSSQEPAIMDELAHIPAGYGYVRYLDFRLNPEHPPLVKALSGVFLLAGGFRFPVEHAAWQKDMNGQWDMGTQFLYFAGNDADKLVQLARVGPMLLTILLTILIYAWSAELIGRRWALLPALLFGISPHVLAHGHYVTTDVVAAFGVVLATYYFIRVLHAPSRRTFIMAGLAFGVAQSGKFSAVLLIPYFVFLAVVYGTAQGIRASQGMAWFSRVKNTALYALRHTVRTAALMVIGFVLVVYPLYFLFTVNYPIEKQHADTK